MAGGWSRGASPCPVDQAAPPSGASGSPAGEDDIRSKITDVAYLEAVDHETQWIMKLRTIMNPVINSK